MPQRIILTPQKLGFITKRQALDLGATESGLASLDYLVYCKRVYYRLIDVQQLTK